MLVALAAGAQAEQIEPGGFADSRWVAAGLECMSSSAAGRVGLAARAAVGHLEFAATRLCLVPASRLSHLELGLEHRTVEQASGTQRSAVGEPVSVSVDVISFSIDYHRLHGLGFRAWVHQNPQFHR